MCGICGIIRFDKKVAPVAIQRMTAAIRHRGPDDEGYISIGDEGNIKSFAGDDTVASLKNSMFSVEGASFSNVWFGFRRLSIIDLSAHGHQPMVTSDRELALIFNGEIYNYKELRQQLQSLGQVFQSNTDTEVILLGYRQWGRGVLEKLNGMFAFAIFDKVAGEVFIARDRLGIKPLFYSLSEQGIVWASEIKAVLQSGLIKSQINWQGLFANYQLQTTPSPFTCFENIHSLEPATFMVVNIYNKKVVKDCYWHIPINQPSITIAAEDTVAELDYRLQNIVARQLRSDVPVTSLMSGGIDSTTLTAICTQQYKGFDCYSLGFDGSGLGADELPQAIAMAKMLGIKQHVHEIKPGDVIDTLDADLRHFEEPYVNLEPAIASSAYLHREGYKVVMNGLGADEVFGGYAHYLDYRNWQDRRKLAFLKGCIPPINDFARKVRSYLSIDSSFKYFINSRMGIRPFEIRQLTDRSFRPVEMFLRDDVDARTIPEELSYYDLKYYIGSHHVYRDDLSSMRYSLEVRYPYLDHELIDWVATLPLSIRYDGATTKPLMRRVAERYITAENMSMPKKGFNLPLDHWMKTSTAIQDYARQHLDALERRDIFDKKTIEKWWRRRDQGVYFSKIWQLVTTEVWMDEYIDA